MNGWRESLFLLEGFDCEIAQGFVVEQLLFELLHLWQVVVIELLVLRLELFLRDLIEEQRGLRDAHVLG